MKESKKHVIATDFDGAGCPIPKRQQEKEEEKKPI